ncbi:DedA family protein [Hephaestia sp. GCM10023244]|uniref:DedA family protein n=1 Tax=unclassified Hephaestia TaxID=2631281 RepID=UPI00207722F4|nr:DedA family protein [Hephaestia sp. MAHUQ-44]MCM8730078.1 DedA family protein [Hephaestia sp. MAHUQ-44]
MDLIFQHLAAFVENHRMWAGPVLGLIAFGESLAIVGLFVPATALMLMIGGLIGSGLIDPLPVLLWSVAGSVLGDAMSYALGRWSGRRLYYRSPLRKHRAMVARARLFFRKYGFWSVLVGRFLGPIRSTIPLVAGVMRMPQRPFQLANVVSALVWVPVMLAPGYFTARKIDGLDQLSGWQWTLAAGVIVLLCLVGPLAGIRMLTARLERPVRKPARVEAQ